MLPFEKALEITTSSVRQLGAERVDIVHAANRILAEDVKSDMDTPPFSKSAMDGFACHRADLANELTIVETISAGYVPEKTIGPNQCAKIMTGAMVPAGADCVVMKEYVERSTPLEISPAFLISLRPVKFLTGSTEKTVRFVGEQTVDNICRKGEDTKAGGTVLHKGAVLRPQHIAILASVGNTQPLVSKRPRVAVIATGDELVEPMSKPGPSQIRNSNSIQLVAQVENIGAIATDYGIAKDTTCDIDSLFERAVVENDVVILSGGVSVGDFDLVPQILEQHGVDLLFDRIAIKPGKPTVFGVSEQVYCFGLPGNPVATFVLFEILVKPFLYMLMGHRYRPCNIQMPMAECIKSKKTERRRWLPVAITEAGTVKPVEYHGSAHISSLCRADGLISMSVGVAEIEEGMTVQVRLI